MIKTKRFCNGKFNYSIKYEQFQQKVIDEDTGAVTLELYHQEKVKSYKFPFTFTTTVQICPCKDTKDYYQQ